MSLLLVNLPAACFGKLEYFMDCINRVLIITRDVGSSNMLAV